MITKRNIAATLVLSCAIVVPIIIAQTGEPNFITKEEAAATYLVPNDLIVPGADIGSYSPTCAPMIAIDADPGIVTHVTGLTDNVNPIIIGTNPSDPIGSSVLVNDSSLTPGARIEISASAVVITNVSTTAEFLVTIDGKVSSATFSQMVSPFSGTAGLRRSITVTSAIRNVANGAVLRIAFRSTGTAATLQLCKASLEVSVQHAQ